jgi:hypothetical protein
MGAGAFTGRARAVFTFVSDLEDKDVHHMVSTKANYAKASGLRYRIDAKLVKLDDGTSEEVPYIVYLGESTGDADVLLDVSSKRRSGPTKTQRAQDFLQEFLSDGPQPQSDCVKGAVDLDISQRTLETAKSNLKIESRKTDGVWLWALPSVSVGLFKDAIREAVTPHVAALRSCHSLETYLTDNKVVSCTVALLPWVKAATPQGCIAVKS